MNKHVKSNQPVVRKRLRKRGPILRAGIKCWFLSRALCKASIPFLSELGMVRIRPVCQLLLWQPRLRCRQFLRGEGSLPNGLPQLSGLSKVGTTLLCSHQPDEETVCSRKYDYGATQPTQLSCIRHCGFLRQQRLSQDPSPSQQ